MNSDPLRIAAESSYILVYPFDSEALISNARIRRPFLQQCSSLSEPED